MKDSAHIALCFVNYGPYHLARLNACIEKGLSVTGLQLAPLQSEYDWKTTESSSIISVFDGQLETVPVSKWAGLVSSALDQMNPDICAVAGYGQPGMRSILSWCMRRRKPIVIMSDSRFEDQPRSKWKEVVKSLIVKSCAAGLVAGTPHVAYLKALGMAEEKIFMGYDTVDNEYFAQKANEARKQKQQLREKFGLPENYFLASARFLEKKNLPRLLQAYAKYHRAASRAEGTKTAQPWKLVLMGDGPLKPTLTALIAELGLQSSVILPGFVQYDQLPTYYGLAQAFVLPSHTMEQWGLVVNEAMASGLPVLVSNACGCSSDLVQEGQNGFTFDPCDVEALANLMVKTADMSTEERNEMGEAGYHIISRWEPTRFVNGLRHAVDCALVGSKRAPILDALSHSLLAVY